MGSCRHNCCIGWEIDIDEKTLEVYRNEGGELGRRLAENISEGDPPFFRLDDMKRCPFLNDANLCDLITERGEEFICDICREHPRFYNFYKDTVEKGIGLSCEAVGDLVFSNTETYVPDELPEDPFFRFKYSLLKMAEDREQDMPRKLERIRDLIRIDDIDVKEWAEFLSGLEFIDEKWISKLHNITDTKKRCFVRNGLTADCFLEYLLFRQLNDQDMIFEQLVFCVVMCELLACLWADETGREEMMETVRLFSQEIEYSPDNMEEIFSHMETIYQ